MRDRFASGERGGGFQARGPGDERRFTGRAPSRFQCGYGPHDRGFERAFERPRFEGRDYTSRGDFFDCAFPTFEQMARHWYSSFGTNPVPDRLLIVALLDFAGLRHRERVDHGLRLL